MEPSELKPILKNWLQRLEAGYGHPDLNIIAFNIGLMETEAGFMGYLVGSAEYTPDDDDWACTPEYDPDGPYLMLPQTITDWKAAETVLKKAMEALLNEGELAATLLDQATVITTGFDDGELIRIK